eukprot:UC1_evm1s1798
MPDLRYNGSPLQPPPPPLQNPQPLPPAELQQHQRGPPRRTVNAKKHMEVAPGPRLGAACAAPLLALVAGSTGSAGVVAAAGAAASDSGLICTYHPGPVKPQCCCQGANQALFCLPTFIVIGAQKSGTTALLGYLLHHPNFRSPSKKEGHFFDRLGYIQDGDNDDGRDAERKQKERERHARRYLTYFDGSRKKDDKVVAGAAPRGMRFGLDTLLTGEASPSYLCGTRVPKLIAGTFPHARLVVLLRDPVARAYSEYNMKLRRVESQPNFENADERDELVAGIRACGGGAWPWGSSEDEWGELDESIARPVLGQNALAAADGGGGGGGGGDLDYRPHGETEWEGWDELDSSFVQCLRNDLTKQIPAFGFIFKRKKAVSAAIRCLRRTRPSNVDEHGVAACFMPPVIR